MRTERLERNAKAISRKHEVMMTEPVQTLVCRLALPSIATMLISSLYNMADTYFVGSLGTSAIGGVGVVFPLMAVIQAFGFFFGHGSGNYVSRKLGAQELDDAKAMAACGFFFSLLGGVFICVLGTAFLESISSVLGATPTIQPYAMEYMRWILLAAPLMTTSLTLNNIFRFQGSSFYGMVGIASGAVINIALDPVFIFILDMGVRGAALATLISQFAGFCLLLAGCGRRGNIPIVLSLFTLSPARFMDIFRGGFPSLCRQGISSFSTVCVNRWAGLYGDAAIAALSIVMRIMMFANSALIGYGQGFQPVCGFNFGARRFDRVRQAFWFCVRSSFVALLLLALCGFVWAPEIITFFRTDDPDVTRIGALSLRMLCCVFPFTGLFVMSNMLMQTIGYSVRASILAVSRQGLFLLPLLFTLAPLYGLFGIQLCQPISDAASFLLALPLSLSALRQMQPKQQKGT